MEGKGKNRYFIITIDTEGDDLWTYKCTRYGLKPITTYNAVNLQRLQNLCEKYDFIPTWLVNYEMSQEKNFQEMAKAALNNKKAEVGMHIHAWNNPPVVHLPYNPKGNHPYIGEYSLKLQWEKMKYLTYTLQDIFQTSITSFRSGRWYLDGFTLHCLKQLGFTADCTVTPGVSWSECIGNHMYGIDYSRYSFHGSYKFPNGIYEVPPTIIGRTEIGEEGIKNRKLWLRPNGNNLQDMLWIVNKMWKNRKVDYLEFMIHSSELTAGMNPTFKTKSSIEKLYEDMDILFKEIHKNQYIGIGLGNYVKKK